MQDAVAYGVAEPGVDGLDAIGHNHHDVTGAAAGNGLLESSFGRHASRQTGNRVGGFVHSDSLEIGLGPLQAGLQLGDRGRRAGLLLPDFLPHRFQALFQLHSQQADIFDHRGPFELAFDISQAVDRLLAALRDAGHRFGEHGQHPLVLSALRPHESRGPFRVILERACYRASDHQQLLGRRLFGQGRRDLPDTGLELFVIDLVAFNRMGFHGLQQDADNAPQSRFRPRTIADKIALD